MPLRPLSSVSSAAAAASPPANPTHIAHAVMSPLDELAEIADQPELQKKALRYFSRCNRLKDFMPYLNYLDSLNDDSVRREFLRTASMAVGIHYNDPYYMTMYAKALFKNRQFEKSFTLGKSVLETFPNDFDALQLLFALHLELNLKPYKDNYISLAATQSYTKVNGITQERPPTLGQVSAGHQEMQKWLNEFIKDKPFLALYNYYHLVPFGFPMGAVIKSFAPVTHCETAAHLVFYYKAMIGLTQCDYTKIRAELLRFTFAQYSQNESSFFDYLTLVHGMGDVHEALGLCQRFLDEVNPYHPKMLLFKMLMLVEERPLTEEELEDCRLFVSESEFDSFHDTMSAWHTYHPTLRELFRNCHFREIDITFWTMCKNRLLIEDNKGATHIALNYLKVKLNEEQYIYSPLYSIVHAELAAVEASVDFEAWNRTWTQQVDRAIDPELGLQTATTYLTIAGIFLEKNEIAKAIPLIEKGFQSKNFSSDCIKKRAQFVILYAKFPFVRKYAAQGFEEYNFYLNSFSNMSLSSSAHGLYHKKVLVYLAFYSDDVSLMKRVEHFTIEVYKSNLAELTPENKNKPNYSLAISSLIVGQQFLRSANLETQNKANGFLKQAYTYSSEGITALPYAKAEFKAGNHDIAFALLHKHSDYMIAENDMEAISIFAKMHFDKGNYEKVVLLLGDYAVLSSQSLDYLIRSYYNLKKHDLCLRSIGRVSPPTPRYNIVKKQIAIEKLEIELSRNLAYYNLTPSFSVADNIVALFLKLEKQKEAVEFFKEFDISQLEANEWTAYTTTALKLGLEQIVYGLLQKRECQGVLKDNFIEAAWRLKHKEIVRLELSKLNGRTDRQIEMQRLLDDEKNEKDGPASFSPGYSPTLDSSSTPTSPMFKTTSPKNILETQKIREKLEQKREKQVESQGLKLKKPAAHLIVPPNSRSASPAPHRAASPIPKREEVVVVKVTQPTDIQKVISNPILFKAEISEDDKGFIMGAKTLLVHLEDSFRSNQLPQGLLLAERTFEIYKIAAILSEVPMFRKLFKPLRNWIRHNPHLINHDFVSNVAALFKLRDLKLSLERLLDGIDDKFYFKIEELGLTKVAKDHKVDRSLLVNCLDKHKTALMNLREKARADDLRDNIQLYRAIQGHALLAGSAARDLYKKHGVRFANHEDAICFIKKSNKVAHSMGSASALSVRDFNSLGKQEALFYVTNIGPILRLR